MYSMLLPSKQNAGKLESINWKTKILIFVSSLKNEMIKTSEIEYLRVRIFKSMHCIKRCYR